MKLENVEDVYPLSPIQQGVLFHTLYAPGSGVYFVQFRGVLKAKLDFPVFKRAWQMVVDRHPILRTAFLWEGLDEPLQVVRQRVELPWDQQDWRGLPPREQEERLEAFLKADREQGFELSRAPLMRLALIQLTEDQYQLIWSHHHLLMDGWSQDILRHEVFSLYDSLCESREVQLKPARPYKEYITWLQQQNLSGAEAFWRERLKGFTAPTPLRVDRLPASLSTQEEGYDVQRMRLSEAMTERLQSLARQQRLTLNTLVLGAWSLLVSRYSGDDDIIFGVTVSGRPAAMAGVESITGPFINTVPVRVRISPGESLLSWLHKLQEQQLEMREFEFSRLVEVQAWSEVPRGVPLFESVFVFENYPREASLDNQCKNLKILILPSIERINYPLAVVVGPSRELLLKAMYDSSRFDPATVTRMLGHLQTLLEGIVANPAQPLRDLSLLTEAERHQQLVEWNNTHVHYPKEMCIQELFEAQVERTPDAIAVVSDNKQLTYQELNCRANQLAHYLREFGVGPELLVSICIESSLEMVVGLLAILKAGGAYVPLDPAYPKERIAFIVEDAQVKVLLTQQRLVAGLPAHGARVICLDTDGEVISQKSEENLVSQALPENLAYMIYTSGSTGRPKGTQIQHSGLVNLVTWHQRVYSVTPADRATQLAAPAFDASVWELWPYLTAGASVHIPNEEILGLPSKLLAWLADKAITICFLPTPLAEAVLEEPRPSGLALRVLLTGGDKLHRRSWRDLSFCLANNYGPTENTVVTTWAPVDTGTETEVPPPIGRPIANTQIYLLDSRLQPVPIGVPGELHIGGDGLARGYLNRPDLTAERFIPNPFSDKPGARMYNTGDLARYLPDGNIEFLGRIDNQVKIRGFRIELGEIEAVLGQHPAVRETVVLARDEVENPKSEIQNPKLGSKRLIAYLIAEPGQAPTINELRSFLKQKLPDYMVPSAFVMLDVLPLSPNGKVDRRALPAPDQRRPELQETFVPPRTPIEEVLTETWSDVLGVEQVGIHDNFFELGGHSLLAIRLISRLRDTFGLEISLRRLFDAPTVAGLSQVLIAHEAKPGQTEKIARVLKRVEGMSAEDLKNTLQKKTGERYGGVHS